MNPYRAEREGVYMRRGHTDELAEDKLIEIMDSLKYVADATDTTLNQVIQVYASATRNRLAEVLLDSGDAFDNVVNAIEEWKRSDGFVRLRLSGDDMADEMRVRIMGEDK